MNRFTAGALNDVDCDVVAGRVKAKHTATQHTSVALEAELQTSVQHTAAQYKVVRKLAAVATFPRLRAEQREIAQRRTAECGCAKCNGVERGGAECNSADRGGAECNSAERSGAECNSAERSGAECNSAERSGATCSDAKCDAEHRGAILVNFQGSDRNTHAAIQSNRRLTFLHLNKPDRALNSNGRQKIDVMQSATAQSLIVASGYESFWNSTTTFRRYGRRDLFRNTAVSFQAAFKTHGANPAVLISTTGLAPPGGRKSRRVSAA